MKKRMYSMYQRHFFLTAAMILLSFVLLGISFLGLTYRFAVQDKKDSMDSETIYIARMVSMLLDASGQEELDNAEIQEHLVEIATRPDADVLICDAEGKLIYAYENTPILSEIAQQESNIHTLMQVSPEILLELRRNGSYHGMVNLGLYPHKRFVTGEEISIHGVGYQGYVFLTASTEELTVLWRTFGIIFAVAAAAVLLIALLSCFVMTRQQVRPLRELTDTMTHFGMGEYSLRASSAQSIEEIAALATAFNNMADSLSTIEEQRQEFVANISHELKTPMTTISGFTDGILDGTIPPEKQRESLQVISDETRRLSRLVRRMLDTSQLAARSSGQEVLCQTQFNITETFAQVLISLERKITSRGLDVDVQFPDTDVMVWGDPDSITQVCYNLMDNAIKFATAGTAIGVSIVPKGTKAWISVRNHGETIPPEELSLVFDRFHKSDRSRSLDKEGVGLGLYIVRTILNNHKETITVTSENGLTEFRFSLTLAQ